MYQTWYVAADPLLTRRRYEEAAAVLCVAGLAGPGDPSTQTASAGWFTKNLLPLLPYEEDAIPGVSPRPGISRTVPRLGRCPTIDSGRPDVAGAAPESIHRNVQVTEARHAHYHHHRCGRDLLQGLGIRPATCLQPRLAVVRRRLGHPAAVLCAARLPGHRPRPARTRPIHSDQ